MEGKQTGLDAKEAAAILGCCARTIQRMAERGEIASYKVGNQRRFRLSALETYMQEQERVNSRAVRSSGSQEGERAIQ